ncbi:hypothetical protein L204_102910 [Cryptococcus depauperatus]|nr:hypothetical protein L204_00344 [Cryptococcus depauperatus CBS 7855]
MPFPSRRLSSPNPLFEKARKHPFALFGLPFMFIIVSSSFALTHFTQTKYDYQESKVKSMSMEEELGMMSGRRKVDLREEYYRLNNPTGEEHPLTLPSSGKKKFSMTPTSTDDYEPIRVPRPAGVPQWGSARAGEEAPIKGSRKEDRWV